MCHVCERPCWRDGGERECDYSDAEFVEYTDWREAEIGAAKGRLAFRNRDDARPTDDYDFPAASDEEAASDWWL